ncbi:MAG: cation diffusion facilitator family transporter [Thermoplasmatota archaeon]
MSSGDERAKEGVKVTLVGSGINVLLTLLKIAAGLIGNSTAMVADGVHSFSDLITDFAVLFGIRMADKPEDETHKWGHGKFETLASVFIGLFLVFIAIGIMISALSDIIDVIRGGVLERPGYIALGAALVSIISKEIIYRYTVSVGRKIDSKAIVANAWHHRTDSLSSIATLAGIGGAILLGGSWTVLDPLAAVIVSVLIVKVGISITKDGLNEFLEASLDRETEDEIMDIISGTPGILTAHDLKTRRIGKNIAIDVHVHVKEDLTIVTAHNISTVAMNRLRERFGDQTHVSIHVEPDDHCSKCPTPCSSSRTC